MSINVQTTMDFGDVRKIVNLPNPTLAKDAATKAYVDSVVEGLAWKDGARVASQAPLNWDAPGYAIDGVTLVVGDRVVVLNQINAAQNGIYIWNGPAVAMTRSADANTIEELQQAIVPVAEGSSAGISYRNSTVGGTLDSSNLVWIPFGSVTPLATSSDVNTGTDAVKAITPLALAGSNLVSKKVFANIGDGLATSYVVTHSFNTLDVAVDVYLNGGTYSDVLVEVQRTSINTVTLVFDTAPATDAYRVAVRT